jgi:HEAT repeat protein
MAPLISALAHGDFRVRREAVRALARQGGEAAGLLALGMLEDPDANVRSSAILTVGALKVEGALRPLLERLEEEDEERLQIEVLNALGRLGDPGAVPAIERKTVGGLLKRSNREVRIAAYQALAAIGTPYALRVIEEAEHDRDPEVRYAVRTLSQGG